LAEYALGRHCAAAGDLRGAAAAYRRAVTIDPLFAIAWLALADTLTESGDRTTADAAYLAHVHASVHDPQSIAAASALREGRLNDAERLLKTRLKSTPTDVGSMRMLAELAGRLGRNEDAHKLLIRALDLAPSFSAARYNNALTLHRLGRNEESLTEVSRLLAADPHNPAYRNLRAAALVRLGDYAEAIAEYETTLEKYPHQPKVWMGLGHALKTVGRTKESVAAYRHSLEQLPHLGESWWSLANLKTFRFNEKDLALMHSALARPNLDDEDRLHLDFTLGKAFEDSGQFEASFKHYERANALRRSLLRYDAADTDAAVELACSTFSAERFARQGRLGCSAADPIFIVGLPRSGSTLIEQILASHSAVEGTMELPDIDIIVRRLHGRHAELNDGQVIDALDAAKLRELGDEYLERTRSQRKTAKPQFIDKMPNNWLHVGLIQLILPHAKIIDARRHPLACCFSAFKQHFARGQAFSYDLRDLGRYYRAYVALMTHFDVITPGRIHRVLYERLVIDTESEIRRLLDYCGLKFEETCLRFHENPRAVRTASSEQVRRPIFTDAVHHWHHYERWLIPLKEALGPTLEIYHEVRVS
jgi:tetratricopeptide (TPR) repeat protein